MNVTTLLIVKDLAEAQTFYVDVMGLSLVKVSGDRLDLDAGGHSIQIFKGDDVARPYSHSSDASATLVFCVASLDEKKLELESLGYKFIHSGENEDSKYAAFWGPSEIVHEISEAAKKP